MIGFPSIGQSLFTLKWSNAFCTVGPALVCIREWPSFGLPHCRDRQVWPSSDPLLSPQPAQNWLALTEAARLGSQDLFNSKGTRSVVAIEFCYAIIVKHAKYTSKNFFLDDGTVVNVFTELFRRQKSIENAFWKLWFCFARNWSMESFLTSKLRIYMKTLLFPIL